MPLASHGAIEPARATLLRLLKATDPCGSGGGTAALPRFGDDVGAEAVGAEVQLVVDVSRAQREPVPSVIEYDRLREWLLTTLVKERGVLSAHGPKAQSVQSLARRIVALDRRVASGHASWWFDVLSHTAFSRRHSRATSSTRGTRTTLHRRGGDPERGFDWFPSGVHFGLAKGVIDAFLHYGLALSISEFPPSLGEAKFDLQMQQASLTILFHLEAASHGIAPVVFATMLIQHGCDDGVPNQVSLRTDSGVVAGDTTAAEAGLTHTPGASDRVNAIVSVAQVHTFTLADMVDAWLTLGVKTNARMAQERVDEALRGVRDQIRRCANVKLLKLNVEADNVVFCPELVDGSDAGGGSENDRFEWELRGVALHTDTFDPTPGQPMLIDFDPRTCKRAVSMKPERGYDADCAFVLMLAMAASALRLRFGDGVGPLVRTLFAGKGDGGRGEEESEMVNKALLSAQAKYEGFASFLESVLLHTCLERDALPASAIRALIDDWRGLFAAGDAPLDADALARRVDRRAIGAAFVDATHGVWRGARRWGDASVSGTGGAEGGAESPSTVATRTAQSASVLAAIRERQLRLFKKYAGGQ